MKKIVNYFVHLCSDDVPNATIAFFEPKNVENDILHGKFRLLLMKFWLLVFWRRPSWIFTDAQGLYITSLL